MDDDNFMYWETMLIETLATGNFQLSGAKGEQKSIILREKVILNLRVHIIVIHPHPPSPMKHRLSDAKL